MFANVFTLSSKKINEIMVNMVMHANKIDSTIYLEILV